MHILPGRPAGKPDQMSPIDAAVPRLFVAVNGLSSVAREAHRERTPFITMDGADLYVVLEGRIRLDDLLSIKQRHANDTGSCYHPAMEII